MSVRGTLCPTMSTTHIALLRGINVGGHHKLPMKELAAMFAAAGCDAVRTYIQSGNVVFEADQTLAAKVPRLIGAAIDTAYGYQIPILTRSADELAAAIDANPYANDDIEARFKAVGFLVQAPDAEALARLDPEFSPPDRFTVIGREIFLCYPNGSARSKLTNAYFDSRLATISTVRNWRTTRKLLELSDPD